MKNIRILSAVLALILCAGMLFACKDVEDVAYDPVMETVATAVYDDAEDYAAQFTLTIVQEDGSAQPYTLGFDQGDTLADVMLRENLVSKEEYESGFFTVINGKTADWSDGEAWWRLTDKSGEATTVGAKDITLAADDAYTFTFTRGMDS